MFENPKNKKLVLGLIHLKPLPNTPFYQSGDLDRSIEKALNDARALIEGGADGCLIQSVDKVYPSTDDTDYIRVAGISVIGNEVRRMAGPEFIIGVQLMWNAITPSLAAAKACGANFTRCSALVGTTPSPFGVIQADPLKVMNYRRHIDAENVSMIAEISGYHFLMDGEYDKTSLIHHAQSATTVGANCLEVYHKDEYINERMVRDIKDALPHMPVILGGGTNLDNCKTRLKYADGALVGSCFEGGNWGGALDINIIREYVHRVREIEN